MVLEESSYVNDQATSDTSIEYDELELSCDEYAMIFNELIIPRRAPRCFDVFLKFFNNFYILMRRRVLSILGVFKPKNVKRHVK